MQILPYKDKIIIIEVRKNIIILNLCLQEINKIEILNDNRVTCFSKAKIVNNILICPRECGVVLWNLDTYERYDIDDTFGCIFE